MAASRSLPLHSAIHALRALGEPSRLRIVHLLARGELTVSELTEVLGQSQPRVSRHLRLLLEAGVVERFAEGASVFYRLADVDAIHAHGAFARKLSEGLDLHDPVLTADLRRLDAVQEQRVSKVAAYFEANAVDWIRLRAVYQPVAAVEAAMAECLAGDPVDLLVDLGTGTGRVLEVLRPYYGRAIGFDVNQAMLRIARVNLARAGIHNAYVRYGDLFSLPRLPEPPDAVVVHQVLHYLDNPAEAVLAAARLLAPGGRILIVDFAPHQIESLRTEHAHRRLGFAESEVRQWYRRAGLEPGTTRHVTVSPGGQPQASVSLWVGRASKKKKLLEAAIG